MTRVAIMQPYFLPYIGYYQLIAAVDLFVVYDGIKYTKKGWINRNRMLLNGEAATFTLPLKAASDSLDIDERELSSDFDRRKLLRQIENAYRHAPYFDETFPRLERIVTYDGENLFAFLLNSLEVSTAHLGIETELRIASAIAADHDLKGAERVLAICDAVGASVYVNAIGGTELYDKGRFRQRGIELRFLKPSPPAYAQFGGDFVPWLSILDVLMFNGAAAVRERYLPAFEFV